MAPNHTNYSAAQLDQPPRRGQYRSKAWFFAHGKFARQAHVAPFWALNFLRGLDANVSNVRFTLESARSMRFGRCPLVPIADMRRLLDHRLYCLN
jgi:hypothetical protein